MGLFLDGMEVGRLSGLPRFRLFACGRLHPCLPKEALDSAKAFLDAYTVAFDTRDGVRISVLYNVPCVTVRGDGSVHCFQSRDEIASFFRRVAEGYAKEGMHAGVYKNLNAVPIGGASVLATVDWEMLREDRTVIRKWRQSYNLIRTAEGWRILCSTIHLP